MERQGDEVHFETDEARGASTPNIVRWVLAISLLAAIVLLSLIWMTGAATQGDEESSVSVRERVLEEYSASRGIRAGETTDSIVGEDADEIDAVEQGEDTVTPTVENDAADEPAAN